MKRTQILELLCNIRATWVSFASIVMFVALGVGLYSGLCWTGQSVKQATNAAYEEGNLHAFEMAFPYGFTDEDIDAIRSLDGVDAAEPGYASAQSIELDGKSYSASMRSLTRDIDAPTVDEGALPENDGEIAIDSLFASSHGLSVGDSISFAHDAADDSQSATNGMKYLINDTFKITALVTSPAYLACSTEYFGVSPTGGAIDVLAYVPETAFNRSAFNDAYVTLEVSSSELRGLDVYSDEYRAKSDEIQQRIEQLGESRADARYRDVIAAAQAKIDEGQARLDAARQQLEDGAQRLTDAQSEVDANTRKLEDAQLELNVTSKMLTSQDSMTQEALDQAAAQIERYQKTYDNAAANVQQKVKQVDELESEAKAVVAFSNASRAALRTLEQRRDELAEAYASGAIDNEEYDEQLEEACATFRTDMRKAGDALKTDAPKAYAQNQKAIDALLAACDLMSGATCDISMTQISRMLDTLDSVSSTATAAAQQARSAADEATAQMNSAKASLDEVRSLYAQRRASYNAQMASARGQVSQGQTQVDSGKQQLADAQIQIDSKKAELEAAQDEYDEGVAKLQQAQDQVSKTATMSWTVTPAYYNGTVQATNEMVGVLYRLRFSMASLFVIVGLLVCYSAVSRIVHEQITQIGTKKAIGFYAHEITLSYLAYTATAVVLGALLGIAVGAAIVEPILIPTMNQCVIDDPAPIVSLPDYLAVSLIDLALILLSTWIACRGVLKRQAVELLQGERPPANRTRFYERWRLWRRLGLLAQTVVNNCVNDKRRVLGTLVGVAGCTALIVSAITMDDNVNASFDKQLADVCAYNAVVYCDPDENDSESTPDATAATPNAAEQTSDDAAAQQQAKPSVGAYLDSEGLEHAAVQRKTFALDKPDGTQGVVRVYTPADPNAFGKLFRLNTYDTPAGTGVLEGAWVCSSYANFFGAKVGDIVEIENAAGQKFEIPIAGFFEYYSSLSAIVLSPAAYERITGSAVEYNAYLVDARDLDSTAFQQQLAESTVDFAGYSDEAASIRSISAMFNNLSFTMVAIYIALSALMAIIVLLNLNVMFINEKKRELIVLMINGYSQRDAKRYIYRDTIVMTVVGIALGCALGCVMGYFSVASLENSSLCMLKTPSLKACLTGAVLCAAFSAIVSAISLRRISKFSLTDINRF